MLILIHQINTNFNLENTHMTILVFDIETIPDVETVATAVLLDK